MYIEMQMEDISKTMMEGEKLEYFHSSYQGLLQIYKVVLRQE